MAKGGGGTTTVHCNTDTGITFPKNVGAGTTLTAKGAHTGKVSDPCALMNLSMQHIVVPTMHSEKDIVNAVLAVPGNRVSAVMNPAGLI